MRRNPVLAIAVVAIAGSFGCNGPQKCRPASPPLAYLPPAKEILPLKTWEGASNRTLTVIDPAGNSYTDYENRSFGRKAYEPPANPPGTQLPPGTNLPPTVVPPPGTNLPPGGLPSYPPLPVPPPAEKGKAPTLMRNDSGPLLEPPVRSTPPRFDDLPPADEKPRDNSRTASRTKR